MLDNHLKMRKFLRNYFSGYQYSLKQVNDIREFYLVQEKKGIYTHIGYTIDTNEDVELRLFYLNKKNREVHDYVFYCFSSTAIEKLLNSESVEMLVCNPLDGGLTHSLSLSDLSMDMDLFLKRKTNSVKAIYR